MPSAHSTPYPRSFSGPLACFPYEHPVESPRHDQIKLRKIFETSNIARFLTAGCITASERDHTPADCCTLIILNRTRAYNLSVTLHDKQCQSHHPFGSISVRKGCVLSVIIEGKQAPPSRASLKRKSKRLSVIGFDIHATLWTHWNGRFRHSPQSAWND